MKNIVLFASGAGTNALNIISYFQKSGFAKVVAIFCNNPNAGVLQIAEKSGIPAIIFSKENLISGNVLFKLRVFNPDIIVLAGFLLKFPDNILHYYPNKIINIHPALLPKYGGKGMYGMNIHRAIYNNKEKETGISIHYVNENYDEGGLIFQQNINIQDCASAEEIAVKIHELEQIYFPVLIEKLLKS